MMQGNSSSDRYNGNKKTSTYNSNNNLNNSSLIKNKQNSKRYSVEKDDRDSISRASTLKDGNESDYTNEIVYDKETNSKVNFTIEDYDEIRYDDDVLNKIGLYYSETRQRR